MSRKTKIVTVPNYTHEPTSNPNIERLCDMNGDWTHYYLKAENRYVKAVNHVLELGHAKGPNFKAYLARSTQEEIRKKMEEKGDEGSRTHRAITDLINGSKVTMSTKYPTDLGDGRQTILLHDEWENLLGFKNWCDKYQPRVVTHEYTVQGEDAAGTLDALLVITVPAGDKEFDKEFWGKDILILIDWKSSAAIWFEYEAQTAAYWQMVKADKKFAKFVKAFEGRIFTGVVRLGTQHKSRYQFVYWDQTKTEGEHWGRFCSAVFIANRYDPDMDFVPNIEQFPIQIITKVPKAKVGRKRKTAPKKEEVVA